MSEGQLTGFVAGAKANGAADQTIISILRNYGWTEREVIEALAHHYESVSGLAAPRRARGSSGAREAFLHLLSFGSLFTWAFAAGALWFTLIEAWLPDPVTAGRSYDNRYSMAGSLASVLGAFPIFILVTRSIWRELVTQPAHAESAVRRWLTWLALLIAAGTLIGDAITFLSYFLRGELSARFVAKVIVVALIAGGVFWFYLRSMRSGEDRAEGLSADARTGMIGATAFVLLTLVLSFVHFGSPGRQRQIEADNRRAEHLDTISEAIRSTGQAPPSLAALTLPSQTLRDPITGEPYAYRAISGNQFQLCAVFAESTLDGPPQSPPFGFHQRFRYHPAGRHCFTESLQSGTPTR